LIALAAGFVQADTWPEALARMPLDPGVRILNRSNCVDLMLRALASNNTVRALVFMPGATDELYFFHRVNAAVTNISPTLFDAVVALTNQTHIAVAWRPPMLLLHTQEDSTEPTSRVDHEGTAAKLRQRLFEPHSLYNDRDWDYLITGLRKKLKVNLRPWEHTHASNHFYRHSFAAWNLNGWEALEAVALAGKTTFTVQRGRVVFAADERIFAPPPDVPTLESFDRLIRPWTLTNGPAR
jgi:hypothetical protein